MIQFPESIPHIILSEGLTAEYKDPVIRTDMDAGPQKTRLRYTAVPKNFSGTLFLKEDERKIFDFFFTQQTKFGALRFAMKNPQTLEYEDFRFTKPPAEINKAGHWEVTINLERL